MFRYTTCMPTSSKQVTLTKEDNAYLIISIKKIIGQLQSISSVIENDKVNSQTLTQLLAVKGGASKVCKEIISRGVLSQIHKYNKEELDKALNIIFKLD